MPTTTPTATTQRLFIIYTYDPDVTGEHGAFSAIYRAPDHKAAALDLIEAEVREIEKDAGDEIETSEDLRLWLTLADDIVVVEIPENAQLGNARRIDLSEQEDFLLEELLRELRPALCEVQA